MSNHFNYPEVEIGGVPYIVYSVGNQTYYFKEQYKLGFENLTQEKLFEFATFVLEVRKSKFDIKERFLIKTGVK